VVVVAAARRCAALLCNCCSPDGVIGLEGSPFQGNNMVEVQLTSLPPDWTADWSEEEINCVVFWLFPFIFSEYWMLHLTTLAAIT